MVRVFSAIRIPWTSGMTTAPLVHPRIPPSRRDSARGAPAATWYMPAIAAVVRRNANSVRATAHFIWERTRSTSRFIPPSSMIVRRARVPT